MKTGVEAGVLAGQTEAYWDEYFMEADTLGYFSQVDVGWLTPFVERFKLPGITKVLELGCGAGAHSLYFASLGVQVTALDLSETAIALARRRASCVDFLVADMARPLPFSDESFDGVFSSLALHYFSSSETFRIFAEIHRVLKAGGLLLFRVNSIEDQTHDYDCCQGVELEPNFFEADGHRRRFFDEAFCKQVLEGWQTFSLEHLMIRGFGRYNGVWSFRAKPVWQALAQKPPSSQQKVVGR